ALALGDRVAVLMGGAVAQLDVPERVFGFPADEEVARFVGVETLLPGTVLGAAEGLVTVQIAGAAVEVAGEGSAGQRVLVCLRPEDVALARAGARPSSVRTPLARPSGHANRLTTRRSVVKFPPSRASVAAIVAPEAARRPRPAR